MFFNSLNRKLKKSYSVINTEIAQMVFPSGEDEYVYVGNMLNKLFGKRDVFEMIKLYVSVYTYYRSTMGNVAKTFSYAKKKAGVTLFDNGVKDLVALVMFIINAPQEDISNPETLHKYRGFVDSYLYTVDVIRNNKWDFKTITSHAGTQESPILVDGVCGVRDYINALNISGVEKITYERTSVLYLTNERCKLTYGIDEYTLYNEEDSSEIAKLWFNIYGTENTDIQPACFSGKEPFSANKIATELFEVGVKESQTIEEIVRNEKKPYNYVQLVNATFAYLYEIWLFNFKGIRGGQSMDVKDIYIKKFNAFKKQAFENVPYKMILENDESFSDMLDRVDARIRTSYHANNYTLIDDGLSEDFILEFITDNDSMQAIKPLIANRIMKDWSALGQSADQCYLT